MSTGEVTYWSSIVPKYIKDKSSYRNTFFDWNNEVFVVITTTLRDSHMRLWNLFSKIQNRTMNK
jgi:hypothetical protein